MTQPVDEGHSKFDWMRLYDFLADCIDHLNRFEKARSHYRDARRAKPYFRMVQHTDKISYANFRQTLQKLDAETWGHQCEVLRLLPSILSHGRLWRDEFPGLVEFVLGVQNRLDDYSRLNYDDVTAKTFAALRENLVKVARVAMAEIANKTISYNIGFIGSVHAQKPLIFRSFGRLGHRVTAYDSLEKAIGARPSIFLLQSMDVKSISRYLTKLDAKAATIIVCPNMNVAEEDAIRCAFQNIWFMRDPESVVEICSAIESVYPHFCDKNFDLAPKSAPEFLQVGQFNILPRATSTHELPDLGPSGAERSPDGPRPPNLLVWESEEFEVPPLPWKLLNALWNNRRQEQETVISQVWGDGGTSDGAVKAAQGKANNVLIEAKTGLTINVKAGYFLPE